MASQQSAFTAPVSVHSLARQWLTLDQDPTTRKEIEDLVAADNTVELENRLRTRITFGTAGLRSAMKAGFAHMNALTVLQASHGLGDYIVASPDSSSGPASPVQSVVIGYDARHNSKRYARLAAAAFLSKGLRVLWFGQLVHTPMVPFAVRQYGAVAGVMVTASHNPKQDNGYKVYWSNGSQIIPPRDVEIAKAINAVRDVATWDENVVDEHKNVEWIFAQATKDYLGALRELVWPMPSVEMVMPFTYTPLHGVGLPFLRQIAHDMWFRGNNLRVVKAQAEPNPEFPTLPFPNPEEKGALDLALREAESNGTTIILANDPDADRFSVAERVDKTRWHQFTGNEMGILLASHVFDTYKGNRARLTMLASTVSSRMLAGMAAKENFHYRETLTGFKWLGSIAHDLQDHEGKEPAFAYEEAIGYMFPSVVWDKDGVAAAAVFLSAWQRWKKQGFTPYQKLQNLYATYGFFADANTYLISPSPAVTNAVFASIRTSNSGSRPDRLGARKILRWRDLTLGFDSGTPDKKPVLPVDPGAQMLTCELEDVVFTVRGSGTEPKIKLYIEGTSTVSASEAKQKAQAVLEDLLREWFRVEECGLRLAGT
jgi:phosphoglucomutase